MTFAGLQFAYSEMLSGAFILSHINPDGLVYENSDKKKPVSKQKHLCLHDYTISNFWFEAQL